MKKFILTLSLFLTILIPMSSSARMRWYWYSDSYGNNYDVMSIGRFDYVSGPRGYSGMGMHIGNSYWYN